MSGPASVEGFALHSGARGAVRFERLDLARPAILRSRGVETRITDLRVVDTVRSTTVEDSSGAVRIGTIEHVLAALGGLGLHAGVAVIVDGAEVPLADGGARRYTDLVRALGIPPSAPSLRVARAGALEHGASRYELEPDDSGGVAVEVSVDFDDARIATHARWSGDADDFRERIAVARTFGFEHEVGELLARGLASHVTPESVVVIGEGRVLTSGAPFTADEPVRHKLLDLVGDLYLHGGPPRGRIRASRPGHEATHAVMARALAEGLVVRA
jgi:UDP-3-O-[3-hydroxymyristoyl] N-acetylglucosamine deacetylase